MPFFSSSTPDNPISSSQARAGLSQLQSIMEQVPPDILRKSLNAARAATYLFKKLTPEQQQYLMNQAMSLGAQHGFSGIPEDKVEQIYGQLPPNLRPKFKALDQFSKKLRGQLPSKLLAQAENLSQTTLKPVAQHIVNTGQLGKTSADLMFVAGIMDKLMQKVNNPTMLEYLVKRACINDYIKSGFFKLANVTPNYYVKQLLLRALA